MKILVFGAHPDDIEVGMGGTIAKYASNNHDVLLVVTTIPNKRDTRIEEAKEAAKVLGAKIRVIDLPTNKVVFDRELTGKFDEVLNEFSPDIVYTHWVHDSHQDHMAVAQATIAATRKNKCSVYMYEQTIPGGIVPHTFRAQTFVDITDFIDHKINSIKAHKSQVGVNGDWWLYGVKGRAMHRGYQINVKFAEVFEVVKDIKKI